MRKVALLGLAAAPGGAGLVRGPRARQRRGLALAMTHAGAEGDTAAQMAEVLGYDLPGDRLHAALNALDRAIEDRTGTFPGEGGEERSIEASIANAPWCQARFPVRPDF